VYVAYPIPRPPLFEPNLYATAQVIETRSTNLGGHHGGGRGRIAEMKPVPGRLHQLSPAAASVHQYFKTYIKYQQ